MSSQAPSYRGYRFPSEIISHAVWLYHRFSLSFRDAEDLLAQLTQRVGESGDLPLVARAIAWHPSSSPPHQAFTGSSKSPQ